MKLLVTGLSGTVGTALSTHLKDQPYELVSWDRSKVDPEDREQGQAYLESIDPAGVIHLALGSEQWAEQLAQFCEERGRRFLFTSTAMVFDASVNGPHRPEDPRNAKDDYGRYKIRCEDRIHSVSKRAMIVRIGWQIGTERGGNQMMEALCHMAESGSIQGSALWIPACSFLSDTAQMIQQLFEANSPGVFHFDSNAQSALTYPQLILKLAKRFQKDWTIVENEDYEHDQRLIDERIEAPCLSSIL